MKVEFGKDYFVLKDITNHYNNSIMANELESFRPVHPGELLKDELAYRHLSQKEVARQLGLPYTAFNEILNGRYCKTINHY